MPTSRVSLPPVAEWGRVPFAAVLGVIVVLGLALQTFLLVRTTSWTVELNRLLTLIPVVVATVSYARIRPATAAWELATLVVWGFLVQRIVVLAWFVVGPALTGEISLAAALLSGGGELRLAELSRFLGTIAVLTGCYAVAASRRDRPLVCALTLGAIPFVMVAIYAII